MSKVSILMNGYNSEQYLKEAIDSIYAQSFQDWEIIFIDNCSTDKTEQIVKSYDEKIKYYKTDKTIPLGAARNFGLQYCHGDYIAFLDTDDIWLVDKLEKQVGVMDGNHNYQLSYGGVIYIDKTGKELGRYLPKAESGNVFAKLLERYEINMQSVLLRNNNAYAFNTKLRHSPDFDLFMTIASEADVYVIKEYIVKYRKLENSLTAKNIDVWWVEFKETLDKIFLKNSRLKTQYAKGYVAAYAKVAYYKAQYLVSLGKRSQARKVLSQAKFVNVQYFILYLISFFPAFVWNFVHRYK